MVHPSPFSPHLVTTKDIATKGEETIPGHSSTTVQNVTPTGITVAEICPTKTQTHQI